VELTARDLMEFRQPGWMDWSLKNASEKDFTEVGGK